MQPGPLIVGSVLAAVGLVVLISGSVTLDRFKDPPEQSALANNTNPVFEDHMNYGLVIDGGSTGSRMQVFRWPKRQSQGPSNITEITSTIAALLTGQAGSLASGYKAGQSYPSGVGISTFGGNLPGVATHLQRLIEFANLGVPVEERAKTPVYLYCTAGMRLLPQTTQDNILAAARTYLATTGYKFQDSYARVISGQEEGVFGWLALNYAQQNLKPYQTTTNGVFDMGGASTQITFETTNGASLAGATPSGLLYNLTLAGIVHQLYSNSYLGYGFDAFLAQLNNQTAVLKMASSSVVTDITISRVDEPCLNFGYEGLPLFNVSGVSYRFVGSGNYDQCYTNITNLLFKSACTQNSKCGVGNVYQPDTEGNFYGISGLFFNAQFFNLLPTSTIQQMEDATKTYCGQDWTTAQTHTPSSTFANVQCERGVYQVALLVEGYRMAKTTTLAYAQTIAGYTASWPLGAIVFASDLYPYGPTLFYYQSLMPDMINTPSPYRRDTKWFAPLMIAMGGLLLVAAIPAFIKGCRTPSGPSSAAPKSAAAASPRDAEKGFSDYSPRGSYEFSEERSPASPSPEVSSGSPRSAQGSYDY